ncbi:Fc.00g079380.m01.CDS01 [Cosmosporella sp. VM-42]
MVSPYEEVPLRTRNAIRLLELSPGTLDDAAIHINLLRTNLAAARNTFEAVSYTWGTNSLHRAIYHGRCHGGQLEVSLNCYTALRYLRDPRESRTLWVDAVCINQSDIQERNIQVRIMGEIFAAASRVVVFLGESDPSSQILFQHFAQTDAWVNSGNNPQALLPPANSVVQGLSNLFKRPWFSRVWVIQELVNASQIVFMCGEDMTTFLTLRSCLYGYSARTRVIMTLPAPIEIILPSFERVREICSTTLQEMYIAVLFTGCCQASDPRDRILALIPLIYQKSTALENLVDYSMSVEDIFEKFLLLLLADVGLIGLSLMRRPHSLEMPSWVPDWSQHTDRTSTIFDGLVYFPEIKLSNHYRDFAITVASDIGGRSHRLLAVKGIQYTRVEQLGPVLLHQTEELSTREMLAKDLFASLNSMRLGAVHPHWPNSIMQALRSVQEQDLHDLLMSEAGVGVTVDQYVEEEVSNIFSCCTDHALFVSSHGQLGLVPKEAQPGDIVCFVKGALDPWILRKQGIDCWKMVSGSCFLLDVYKAAMREHQRSRRHPSYIGYVQDAMPNQEVLEEFCIW